jgi:triacylglycerol lipase
MPVQTFDHQATGYSVGQAYWLAEAARLAYQSPDTIEATTRDWGFDRIRHHQTTFRPPFPLEDTQAFTAASDHMVLTSFRGTQPTEIRDWLSDVNTPPWPGPAGTGFVHFGFAEALDSVYPQVLDAVATLRDNNQTIWFTGHSLGGALAALAAMRLHFEQPQLLADGVYTYGQPRVCDHILATAHDTAFRDRTHRFVNNNDIVPQVPPEPVFHHIRTLHHIDADGTLRDSAPLLGGLTSGVRAVTKDSFAPTSDGIRDHFIDHYIDALRRNVG